MYHYNMGIVDLFNLPKQLDADDVSISARQSSLSTQCV